MKSFRKLSFCLAVSSAAAAGIILPLDTSPILAEEQTTQQTPAVNSTQAHTTHTWGNPSWTWSEDHTSATVTLTCQQGGETKTVNATVTKTILKPATCAQEGKVRYFAKAVTDNGTFVDWKTDTLPKTAHHYGNPQWTWNGLASAKVTLTCSVCGHTETFDATMSTRVLKPAMCTQQGKGTRYARYDYNGSTWVDYQTFQTPTEEHDYENPVWNWNEDHTAATVTVTCAVCGEEKTFDATVTNSVTDPTCTENGTKVAAASATIPANVSIDVATYPENTTVPTQTKTITDTYSEEIPATGHEWGDAQWTWNDDNTKATVTLTCANCGETKTLEAEITKEVLSEPTDKEDGAALYIAAVQDEDGTVWYSWKLMSVPKTGKAEVKKDGAGTKKDAAVKTVKATVIKKETIKSPETGTEEHTGFYAMTAALSAALFAVFKRKKRNA